MDLFRKESGQTGSEYMMIISVVVVALVAGAYAFVPSFKAGTEVLGHDVSTILATHQIDGQGVGANSGTGSTTGPNGSNATGSGPNGGAPNGSESERGVYQESDDDSFLSRWFGISRTRRASSDGTGGQDVSDHVISAATMDDRSGLSEESGASYLQGDVQAAMEGSDLDPLDPNCGGAILAALSDRTFDSSFKDQLAQGDFLETVITETKVAGVTISTTEDTPGVMASSEMDRYLREEMDWSSSYQKNQSMSDIESALGRGETVIALYDRGNNGNLDGTNNHFAIVQYTTDWAPAAADGTPPPPGPYVVLDHIGGREYMPISKFEERLGASGGHVVAGTPPTTPANSDSNVASNSTRP